MKSILILLQSYYENDVRVRRKAETLAAAGWHVDVMALRSFYSASRNYVLNGVNVYAFPLRKKRGSKGRYFLEYLTFFAWTSLKQFDMMRRYSYDIVDVNTLPDFLVFSTLYSRWKGAKIVLDMHEITPEFFMSKYRIQANHWQVQLARFIERKSFSYADYVITINEPIQQLLAKRGLAVSKTTVIMNSADETNFDSVMKSESDLEICAEPKKFVMMYHGTLTPIYGLDIALEAFGMVHRQIPDAELWIIGDGSQKSCLEELVRKLNLNSKVRFTGSVQQEKIPYFIARCAIGILPTRQDVFLDLSFSNKLSEYIIMGKAIIASRLKTINHYFSEDALAYFKPNNAAELANQMVRLYSDQDLRARLSRHARLEYAPIRWGVMRQRYLNMVEAISKKQSSS